MLPESSNETNERMFMVWNSTDPSILLKIKILVVRGKVQKKRRVIRMIRWSRMYFLRIYEV
jgi:hypothetical protein